MAAVHFGCGQCLHCRISQTRTWIHRLLLENMTAVDSVFLTLTYDDEFLPPDNNLCKTDLTKYIKRIRKNEEPAKLRYYAVGEYGRQTARPHYHILFFSSAPLDRDGLVSRWSFQGVPMGWSSIGDVSKNSISYTCGYIAKKVENTWDYRLTGKTKEYMTCSKMKGGMGYQAIKHVANSLKVEKQFDKSKEIVNSLTYGKKQLPLGRYLTKKLSEELNQCHKPLIESYWKYYNEQYSKHLEESGTHGDFIRKVHEEKTADRASQSGRFKIFSSKRTL